MRELRGVGTSLRWRHARLGAVALAMIAAVSALGLAAPLPALVGGSLAWWGSGPTAFATTLPSYCNPVSSAPASLYLPLPAPVQKIAPGGTVTAHVEAAVVNYTSAENGTRLSVPTLTASFPLAPSGKLSIVLPPATWTVSQAGWSASVSESKTKTLSGTTAFPAAGSAYLSSSLLAVMGSADYGSLQVAFRWQWTEVTSPGSAPISSAWTTPNATAVSPARPSLFEPAPYVGIVGTSPQPAPAGSNFSVTLSGAVANGSFRMVVEYPNNGTEISSIWESSPPGATSFNGSSPLSFRNGTPLPSGKYLVHVHDVCEALLRSLSLTVTSGSGAPFGGTAPASSVPPGAPDGARTLRGG